MKLIKNVFPCLFSLLFACALAAAPESVVLAQDWKISTQAEWDALFNEKGQTASCERVEIVSGEIQNSHPFTCTELILQENQNETVKLSTTADITANNIELNKYTSLDMQNKANIYGSVVVKGGGLLNASVYGDVDYQGGQIMPFPVIHNGKFYNNDQWELMDNNNTWVSAGKWIEYFDCDHPQLDWTNPTQNGDGRISWQAVQGASKYTVNLHKDSRQNAPVATITTAELFCDFSDAIKKSGSGTYFLSAKSIGQPPYQDSSENWFTYCDSDLLFDYASISYTVTEPVEPTPTPTPTPDPQPTPDSPTAAPSAKTSVTTSTPQIKSAAPATGDVQNGSVFLWLTVLSGGAGLAALLSMKKRAKQSK